MCRKACAIVTLTTLNHTWIGLGSNLSLLGVSQTTNCQSHDMASCYTEHRNKVYKGHLNGINSRKRKRERESSSYSKIMILWDVGLCSFIARYQQFEINLLPLLTKE